MKRRLYPPTVLDRFNFWAGVLCTSVACRIAIIDRSIWGDLRYFLWGNLAVALLNFLLAYVFQNEPRDTEQSKYSKMIDTLSSMESTLNDLRVFLVQEQKRVIETKETIDKLQEEKQTLAPVVETQRATVEAILAAYSSNLRSSMWKDRLFGFTIGILSSLAAAYIFNAINK